ncbi:Aminodeoxychorismate lyase precursor [gamma proteobacterium HdN1]|nr:Aminodeoxychorismate lyase precursor [gamma proteobacterium HdN1]
MRALTHPWIAHASLWGLVALVIAFRVWVADYERPLPVDGAESRLEVAKGAGLSQIAVQCKAKGWVDSPRFLSYYGRLFGYAGGLKAGEYRVTPGMNLKDLLHKMQKGDVVVYQITLVEGQTWRDYVRQLKDAENIESTIDPDDEKALATRLNEPYPTPDGLLYPDTYFYHKGETDFDILQRAQRRLKEVLDREWQNRAQGLPYHSPYEALIMASIVEKETGVEAERARIAGVFVRRLQQGMRMQTDPTVIYGLGKAYDGKLTKSHLQTPNPYNTYLNIGLPPTPIASAGVAAIHAALHPAAGDELYFVATGEGKHKFSVTLAEHEQAVTQFQRNRRADYRSSPKK